jgi:hypothetical protein
MFQRISKLFGFREKSQRVDPIQFATQQLIAHVHNYPNNGFVHTFSFGDVYFRYKEFPIGKKKMKFATFGTYSCSPKIIQQLALNLEREGFNVYFEALSDKQISNFTTFFFENGYLQSPQDKTSFYCWGLK